jgi:hypothetical protein
VLLAAYAEPAPTATMLAVSATAATPRPSFEIFNFDIYTPPERFYGLRDSKVIRLPRLFVRVHTFAENVSRFAFVAMGPFDPNRQIFLQGPPGECGSHRNDVRLVPAGREANERLWFFYNAYVPDR